MNFGFLKNKYFWIFLGILALFFALRLPGIHMPYHQDEYKWPLYAEEIVYKPGSVPHPPLTEFIYRVIGKHIGLDNFRFIPLTFSFLNIFLLFYLVKTIFEDREDKNKIALWTTFVFAISFYSVLASLMVDVDGAVMPFFFLLMMIGYYKSKQLVLKSEFSFNAKFWFWSLISLVGAIGGFLVKVVTILPIFAVFVDFLIERGVFSDKKKVLKYLGFGGLGIIVLVLILFLIKFIFPFFDLSKSIKYWEHFAVFSGRGWTQTFIQFVKSILYTSPLLVVPLLFVDKDTVKKLRVFYLFVFIETIFYIFVFDFSLGAIDRYFEFLIIPLSVIVGFIFSNINFKEVLVKNKIYQLSLVFLITFAVFLTQFLNHFIPPLYPKTEWLSRVTHFKLNFLFPFMGGSGPIPFYVSFLFTFLVWMVSIISVFVYFKNKKFKNIVLFGLLVFGVLYNIIFTEEYLFGKINGSSKKLVYEAVAFIKENKNIKNILVYNDNGGYDIRKTEKYERRIYATPQFEEFYKTLFKDYRGHILMIDIPKIDKNSFYQKYFGSCEIIYNEKDKKISSIIYDCK